MENREALSGNRINRLATITMTSLALLGGNAIKSDVALAEGRVDLDITCPSTGYQPYDDPCVGRPDGTQIITTTYDDYPATDPAETRTLYMSPNSTREAVYGLSYGTRDVLYDSTGAKTQCYVYPNVGQVEDCSTYDTTNSTSDVAITDEMTIGNPTGGGDTGGGDTGGDGGTGGGETDGGDTGRDDETDDETTPTPIVDPAPDWTLIQDCVNKDANIALHLKAIKKPLIFLPRTTLTQARFRTIQQVDSECAKVDTERSISAQYYQIGKDGKSHAVTRRINLVNPENDNGNLHSRKVRSIRQLLCGKNRKYWVIYRAKSYSDVGHNDATIRITNTPKKAVVTQKFAKRCS